MQQPIMWVPLVKPQVQLPSTFLGFKGGQGFSQESPQSSYSVYGMLASQAQEMCHLMVLNVPYSSCDKNSVLYWCRNETVKTGVGTRSEWNSWKKISWFCYSLELLGIPRMRGVGSSFCLLMMYLVLRLVCSPICQPSIVADRFLNSVLEGRFRSFLSYRTKQNKQGIHVTTKPVSVLQNPNSVPFCSSIPLWPWSQGPSSLAWMTTST